MLHIFIKLLRHDISSGFSQNRVRLLLAFLVVTVLCMNFMLVSTDVMVISDDNFVPIGNDTRSVSDYLIYITCGIDVYDPASGKPFDFPIMWAILQIVVLLLVADYPTKDFHDYAYNTFLRAKSKWLWWCSKVVWTLLQVLVVYLITLMIATFFTLAVDSFTVFPQSDISWFVCGIDASSLPVRDLLLSLLVNAFVSMFLAILLMVLSFVVKPIFAFFATSAYIIASIFFHTPIFFADFGMLLRSRIVLSESLEPSTMIVICAAATILLVITGGAYFNKRDVL